MRLVFDLQAHKSGTLQSPESEHGTVNQNLQPTLGAQRTLIKFFILFMLDNYKLSHVEERNCKFRSAGVVRPINLRCSSLFSFHYSLFALMRN